MLLAGHAVRFHLETHPQRGRVLVARLPLDETGRAIADRARQVGATVEVVDPDADLYKAPPRAVPPSPPEPAALPPATESPVDVMRARALELGWLADDIAGLDRPLDVSMITGLSLAEHTLCAPPPTWSSEREGRYPQDCLDWHAPPAFVPRSLPPKVEPEPEPEPEELAPEDVVEPEVVEETPEAEAELEKATEPEPVDVDDEALASYGTAEQVAEARAVIADLAEKKGGATPSLQQSNYYLRKADLPTADSDEYAALTADL